jgi:hypothetical protein
MVVFRSTLAQPLGRAMVRMMGLDRARVEKIAKLIAFDALEEKVFSDAFHGPIRDRRHLKLGEFVDIVRWKSPRQEPNARRNTAGDVEAVTRQAFQTADPRLATWMLCYLRAVSVRMASAILTIYDPNRFTVLDVRAWTALRKLGLLDRLGLSGYDRPDGAHLDRCETYGAYLEACTALASEIQVSLRILDRCLWTIDKKGLYEWARCGVSLDPIMGMSTGQGGELADGG